MIISYFTLLPIDNLHAVAVDSGTAINRIPVGDKLIELDVVATITNVSIKIKIVVIVLSFLYFFWICCFYL